ncbi:MAG: cytochrome c biogenesis protein CcsA [Planctomycetales bacterium]|nr:cytochrome c biogenesis protein CcsA [Planctomycetales bacterium]
MSRWISAAIYTGLIIGATSAKAADRRVDVQAWRPICVLSDGRFKPLDTFAQETLWRTSNSHGLRDPQSSVRLDATAAYLTMLFEWQGWDHSQRDRMLELKDWCPIYFQFHQADKWDKMPLLPIEDAQLRERLTLPAKELLVSAERLNKIQVYDTRTDKALSFDAWAKRLIDAESKGEELTRVEVEAIELADRYWTYQRARMGRLAKWLPSDEVEPQRWLTCGQLLLQKFDDDTDPSGELRKIQKHLQQARQAFLAGHTSDFHQASSDLAAAFGQIGKKYSGAPKESAMQLEVAYNHWRPFRLAWISFFGACCLFSVHHRRRRGSFFASALIAYAIGLMAVFAGLAMRGMIANRIPAANMFETVLLVAGGIALLALALQWRYRNKAILVAASMTTAILLAAADGSPAVFDPRMNPLDPVLRSNSLLVAHVLAVSLSFAAFALGATLANLTLYSHWRNRSEYTKLRALCQATLLTTRLGVLLLVLGLGFGAVWADAAWGRFWAWDPKEVWSLITLLGYLALLHARSAGMVGEKGLAAASIVCFSLVVMTWYGVNFVLAAGAHSYGFGAGGTGMVVVGLVLQWTFAIIALVRSHVAQLPSWPNTAIEAQMASMRA